jgi:hypothetical protein
MKKIFTLLTFILLITGCAAANGNDNQRTINRPHFAGGQISGIVERGTNNRICIISNHHNRSRTSYYVSGQAASPLDNHIGKYVIVEGHVTDNPDNPFVKYISIRRIEFIGVEPPDKR